MMRPAMVCHFFQPSSQGIKKGRALAAHKYNTWIAYPTAHTTKNQELRTRVMPFEKLLLFIPLKQKERWAFLVLRESMLGLLQCYMEAKGHPSTEVLQCGGHGGAVRSLRYWCSPVSPRATCHCNCVCPPRNLVVLRSLICSLNWEICSSVHSRITACCMHAIIPAILPSRNSPRSILEKLLINWIVSFT